MGLDRSYDISGFELSEPLLDAAAYNTYVETVGNKADTLYLRAKESLTEMTTYSYLAYLKRLSDKFEWKSKKGFLAFDYTDEDFYGDVQGLNIHGWKKGEGITGKFKFLTCSLISDDIPEKIPLISIPIQISISEFVNPLKKTGLVKSILLHRNPLAGRLKSYSTDVFRFLPKDLFGCATLWLQTLCISIRNDLKVTSSFL